MAQLEIQIPAMGEGITEASITKILKNIGDKVELDEAILEIATDKVDTEIVAPQNGKIEKILFAEGDVVQVGQTVVIFEVEGAKQKNESENTITEKENTVETNRDIPEKEVANSIPDNTNILYNSKTPNGKLLSPLVRSIAQKENLSLADLESIDGSGVGSRITKNDVLNYIGSGKQLGLGKNSSIGAVKSKNVISRGENFELIVMDRMRKLIADHMIESKKTSAHVTSFIEVDVTDIVNWREKVKDQFLKKHAEKITFTPIFIEAIVRAIKEFPMINVSVDGATIILKKDINIGMATALPSGNLIVPVIKNTSELSLLGITKKVNDLAHRARNNKLKPDEIQGGTFTLTNLGSFGNLTGTPIINQPEVAIVAVGAIKKKPAVIETPQGDSIGIRHLMIMSMSYDHRVVDGALGGMFLKRVADILEDFDTKRDI